MYLSTERLILRPLQADDLPDMQRYAVRPDFWRFLPLERQTAESVADYLAQRLLEAQDERARGFVFAIEPRDLGHMVGTVRVKETSPQDRSGDIGYAMDSTIRGQGYMTEAVARVIAFGNEHLSLHRVWAMADVRNTASWRLLERVGMQREGRLRDHKLIRGNWCDSYLYARIFPEHSD